jgi:hypothetical protein
MKGDFSRLTFDPRKHYAGVLHQQGRVWLDSDWNEDVFERLAVLQQELNDVVGPSGVPSPGTAFQISPSTDPANPDNFHIAGGHCYVNGILCQFDADTTYFGQPDLWDPPPVPIPRDGSTLTALIYLEVWQRLITYLEDDSIREIALGGPDTSARLKTIVQVKVAPLPNGNNNIDCGQSRKFLPVPGNGTLTTLQPTASQSPDLCKLPDPANYTGRRNHLYRVQVHDSGDVAGDNSGFAFTMTLAADANANDKSLRVSATLSTLQVGAALRSGFVTVSDNSGTSERVQLASISTDGVTLNLVQPLKNSYTQARAASVTAGVARFKWSRDNAAFAVGVQNVQSDGVTLTLTNLGRDVATSLRQGDLVELTDDASELGPERGHLTFLVSDPDPDQFTAVIADPLPPNFVLDGNTNPPSGASVRHLILRRWDGIGDASSSYSDTATPGMNLGDGVHVQFSGADLRAGDYWNFTARTADNSVEALTKAPPAGITRYWAPLAVVSWGPQPQTSPPSSPPAGSTAMTRLVDCRNIFPALINFPQADRGFHITGLSTVSPLNAVSTLLNDSSVEITSFAGINVQCDAPVAHSSVSSPACFVTVDVPFGPGSLTVTLAGIADLDSTGTMITWRPASMPALQTFLNGVFAQIAADAGILTRFVLKGNFIWSQTDPTLFLDGEAFGAQFDTVSGPVRTGSVGANTAVSLPSGDKRRGGDFEMWFWLLAAPSFVIDMEAAPSRTIYVGDSAIVTVTLSAPAPSGNAGVTLTLDTDNLAVSGTTPIPVAAGATSTTCTVTGAKQGQTTITAVFGPAGQSVSLTFTIAPLPDLTGALRINPPRITRGDTATGTLNLAGPAPSHGTPVTLTSSDASIAQVADTVTVPAGASSLSFTINSAQNSGTATITAKATTGQQTLTAQLTVVPSAKDTKDQKDNKDTPDNKQAKDTKDTKDQKESKDSADKANKDNADTKRDKDSKDTKDRKENSKEGKESAKEIEDRKAIEIQVPAPFGLRVPNGGNGGAHIGRKDGPPVQPTAQTFILPQERPAVGQSALTDSSDLERDSGRSGRRMPTLLPAASADNPAAAEPASDPGKQKGRKPTPKKRRPRKK